MYCIALNGPPRSGKDTIANIIDERFELAITPVIRKILIMPCRLATYAFLGVRYDDAHYEANKDIPQKVLGGRTIRQFMIDIMEQHIKPSYGEDFAVRSLVNSLGTAIHLPGICVISDLGFQIEIESLENAFAPERVLCVQLERNGLTFEGDSRGYVKGFNTFRWQNRDGEQELVVDDILTYCEAMLGWEI